MARKRKINTRVVTVLSIVGGLCVLLLVAFVLAKILPKDYKVAMERAAKAEAKGNLPEAEKLYEDVKNVPKDDNVKAEIYLKLAKVQWSYFARPEHASIAREKSELAAKNAVTSLQWVDSEETHRLLADIYAGRGFIKLFIAQADILLKIKPNDHELLHRRTQMAARMVNRENPQGSDVVVKGYKECIRLKPDEPQYYIDYANYLTSVPDLDEPAWVIKQGLAANPKSGKLMVEQAYMLEREGRRSEASEAFKKAQAQAGTDPDVWEAVALSNLRRNLLDEAMGAIATLKKLDPARPWSYLMEGYVDVRKGKSDEAIECFRNGLKTIAQTPTTKQSYDVEGSFRYGRRLLAARLGELLTNRILFAPKGDLTDVQRTAMGNEAQQCLDKVVAEEGKETFWAKAIMGRQALIKSRTPEGKEALTTAISLLTAAYEDGSTVRQSPDATTFFVVGPALDVTATLLYNAYERNGTPGLGEKILLDYIKFDEKNPQINLALAKHYFNHNNDAVLAQKYVNAALSVDPEYNDAKELKKTIDFVINPESRVANPSMPVSMLVATLQRLLSEGKTAQATALMEDVYKKQPENLQLFTILAELYLRNNETKKALDLFQDQIGRQKNNPKLQALLQNRWEVLKEKDPNKRYALLVQATESEQTVEVKVWIEKAKLAIQFGKQSDLVDFVQRAEKADPNDPDVINLQFELALYDKNWDRAQQYVERGTKTNADKCKGLKFKVRLLAAQGKNDESIAVMEDILKVTPDDKAVRSALGNMYLGIGKKKEARDHFQYLATSDPRFFEGVKGMAIVTADDPTQAQAHREWVRRCLQLQPQDRDVLNWELDLMVQEGRESEATAKRRQMFDQDPNDLQNVEALAKLLERNQPTAAKGMYEALLKQSPKPLNVAYLYCTFLINNKEESEVQGVMERLVARNDIDRVAAYVLYGDLISPLNRESARTAYQKAIELSAKSDGRAQLAMGKFQVRIGKPGEALACYEKWLEATPSAAGSEEEFRLIALRMETGQAEQINKAKSRLEQIIKGDNGNMKALFAMAELYNVQKDNKKALEMLDAAVRLNPTRTEPLLERARFQQEIMGNLPEAEKNIQQAKALDGANLRVAMSLANNQVRQHKLKVAAATLKLIRDQDPTYEPAIDMTVSVFMQLKQWTAIEGLLKELRAKPSYRGDKSKQAQLYMIEAKMYHDSQEKAKCFAALDAAYKILGDDLAFLKGYCLWHVEFKDYDRVLTEVKLRTDPSYRILHVYEAAALIGKNRISEATAILTPLVKDPQIQLFELLEYCGKIYPPAEGVKVAQQWLTLRDEPVMHAFLGDMYAANKDIVSAEMAYTDGLKKARSDGEKLVLNSKLAQSLYNRYLDDRTKHEYLPKAIAGWKEVLKLDETNFAALNNLAYVYTDDMDSPADALEYAKAAVRCDPQPNVLDTLGWTQARLAAAVTDKDRRQQDLQAALALLQRAFDLEEELSPHTVPIPYHLAWVHEQLGDKSKAQGMYRIAEAALKDNQKDPLYQLVSNGIERTK